MDHVPPRPVTRMTTPMLTVLATLLDGDGWYGLRIAEATVLRTGTIYPVLARFEQAGWVTSTWEDRNGPDARNDPGARRRYYRLTPEGRERARGALSSRRLILTPAAAG